MELSSKNSINNDKSLCLFCDKSFANVKDQKNHVEREHKTILCKGKGSRKSERITKNNSTLENSPFPGCFYCNKRHVRSDDLDNLFQHLLSSHKDVYFGCKCKIRTQDKVSLANHKKTCKIGGGGKSACSSEENVTDNRKASKKSQTTKINGDSKCDSLSESDDNVSAAAATISKKTLPANAIHKKSDRSKLKNLSKNASVNDKGKKNKFSSSSSTTSTSTSSSSNKTGEDEYTIPLTRQKLKEPPSRLGAAQNRTAGNKKSHKTNKLIDIKNITTPSPPTKVLRAKASKIVSASASSSYNPEPTESVLKNEPVSYEFEEDFYRNISQNVRLNLTCFVDGKSDQLQNRLPVFDHLSEQACCASEKKVALPVHDREIHEATNFDLFTPFPALLTAEQYGFGDSNPNKNKRQITKNSWKWKWDLIKKYKYVNEGGKIVKKVKHITTGLKDLSQLDMWTQLSMRSRYENLNLQNGSEFDEGLSERLSTRTIKTQNIEQLNTILDKRLTPEIDIEQLQQTVIKLEPEEKEEFSENFEMEAEADEKDGQPELLDMLNLVKTNVSKPSKTLLSGEWARPRCYICLDCGVKFDLMKSLNDHKNSEHPYVVSAHYEIVGRENLEQKLYKNLFLPKKALQASGFARSLSVNSDSKSNETNEASTSSDSSSKFFADQKEKECSKCLKMIKYSSDIDIYKHILECIEDRAWMQAKRRSKYRRSRRKSRKTTRKSRLSIDQKKITSSPSTKDNTEGENSISNPPTPKSDPKISSISSKTNKIEPLLTENKTVNGKTNDTMSIKNFFRVSKTTPVVAQKVVVQMLEIQPANQSSSLRSSLRSLRSTNSDKNLKNISKSKPENLKNEKPESEEKFPTEKAETPSMPMKSPLEPLLICTPEKSAIDLQLISPASSSSLVSPTSNSNVPKKKKKLNDCIAMLTCKIQEKLGVNFFDSKAEKTEISPSKTAVEIKSSPSTSFQIESLLKENKFTSPIQDEVIDLSVKKKPEEPKTETLTIEIETLKVAEAEVEQEKTETKEENEALKVSEAASKVSQEAQDLKTAKETEETPKVPTEIEVEAEEKVVERKKSAQPPKRVRKKVSKARQKVSVEIKESFDEKIAAEAPKVQEKIESLKQPEALIPEATEKLKDEKAVEDEKTLEEEKALEELKKLKALEDEKALEELEKLKALEEEKALEELKKLKALEEQKLTEKLEEEKALKVLKRETALKELKEQKALEVLERKKALKTSKEQKALEVLEREKALKESKEQKALEVLEREKALEVLEGDKSLEELESCKSLEKIEKEKALEPEKLLEEDLEENSNKVDLEEVLVKFELEKEPSRAEKSIPEPENVFIEDLNVKESFKISIPKERIPNLKEILDQYQVITVNNIKISESERRAFEEQKNRILQILNKTKNLTNKKATAKKVPARKASLRKGRNFKKKEPVAKKKPETPVPEIEKTGEEIVVEKIEEAIKTTNRIRCRRLSVVVDPIINLSSFQHKNRKMRLTNNSQQNGFYDLLAASEQFFAGNKNSVKQKVKVDEEIAELKVPTPEVLVAEPEKAEVVETIIAVKETRAAKATAKELISSEKSKETISKKTEIISPQKPKTKEDDKILPTSEKESENATDVQTSALEPEKLHATPKKSNRGKKQNVENISAIIAEKEPENVSIEVEEKIEETKPKTTRQKANAKKKNILPLEEIKVEQSGKAANVKDAPEKRRKLPRRRQQPAAKEENLLDISFSSDTSNENDIPLAKLRAVANEVVKNPEVIETKDEIVKEVEVLETEEQPEVTVEDIKIQFETPKNTPEVQKAKKPTKKKQKSSTQTPVQEAKKTVKKLEVSPEEVELPETQEKTEIVEKFKTFLNKTSSLIDLSASSDVDTRKSFDPFTINEDSFFNDDLDNDPSDKINDIVNNIINSSEFQIDSDTEKSEIYQGSVDGKSKSTSCTICKRTFRTEKVLEKHCMTSTHIMKVQRKHRGIARLKDPHGSKIQSEVLVKERAPSPILDETKVFRTKGALKTFDIDVDKPKDENDLTRQQKMLNANDDKIYYEFKMEKKPEDMTPKDKDQLFDSLFNRLEAKAQEKQTCYTPKPNFLVATPQDSEMESSSTSWDLKHDADIEWEAEAVDNVPFANAIKERYPKKFPVKINRHKDTAVSIPTKSLIMGKIFKKHRDREKQKTPQADAPNNKPGIKNSLDEIFDHLKNTAEIDDKVLTCPSPKTLLKSGTFSPHSSQSNDMLETASHSNINNNIYKINAPEKEVAQQLIESINENDGKRKSRRRCAIAAKTFAETWSSDEYEELHDTEDIISIINEIEKREMIKKRKPSKLLDNNLEKADSVSEIPVKIDKPSSIMKSTDVEKVEKKKSVQIHEILKTEKASNVTKKRRISIAKDGHKSDEETFTATKDALPLKVGSCIKKRRMSCFVPSTPSFVERPKPKLVVEKSKPPLRIEAETLRKFEKSHEILEPKPKASSVKKSDSEKSFKNQKKFVNLLSNFGAQVAKKKVQKHRKRPRNKVKNIAYDSDSDFELNLNKKSRAAATTPAPFSEISSSSSEAEDDNDDVVFTPKPCKSQTIINASRSSNTNDMTMIKESKLLPNDLKHVVTSTTSSTFKAAIPEDILDSSQSACNRTKRHSSEKLYYWSSSSSESDQEQGDTADGDNEDSVMPHQPEQHGWIVGASHKKLVTLLAHAKIKNKLTN